MLAQPVPQVNLLRGTGGILRWKPAGSPGWAHQLRLPRPEHHAPTVVEPSASGGRVETTYCGSWSRYPRLSARYSTTVWRERGHRGGCPGDGRRRKDLAYLQEW